MTTKYLNMTINMRVILCRRVSLSNLRPPRSSHSKPAAAAARCIPSSSPPSVHVVTARASFFATASLRAPGDQLHVTQHLSHCVFLRTSSIPTRRVCVISTSTLSNQTRGVFCSICCRLFLSDSAIEDETTSCHRPAA